YLEPILNGLRFNDSTKDITIKQLSDSKRQGSLERRSADLIERLAFSLQNIFDVFRVLKEVEKEGYPIRFGDIYLETRQACEQQIAKLFYSNEGGAASQQNNTSYADYVDLKTLPCVRITSVSSPPTKSMTVTLETVQIAVRLYDEVYYPQSMNLFNCQDDDFEDNAHDNEYGRKILLFPFKIILKASLTQTGGPFKNAGRNDIDVDKIISNLVNKQLLKSGRYLKSSARNIICWIRWFPDCQAEEQLADLMKNLSDDYGFPLYQYLHTIENISDCHPNTEALQITDNRNEDIKGLQQKISLLKQNLDVKNQQRMKPSNHASLDSNTPGTRMDGGTTVAGGSMNRTTNDGTNQISDLSLSTTHIYNNVSTNHLSFENQATRSSFDSYDGHTDYNSVRRVSKVNTSLSTNDHLREHHSAAFHVATSINHNHSNQRMNIFTVQTEAISAHVDAISRETREKYSKLQERPTSTTEVLPESSADPVVRETEQVLNELEEILTTGHEVLNGGNGPLGDITNGFHYEGNNETNENAASQSKKRKREPVSTVDDNAVVKKSTLKQQDDTEVIIDGHPVRSTMRSYCKKILLCGSAVITGTKLNRTITHATLPDLYKCCQFLADIGILELKEKFLGNKTTYYSCYIKRIPITPSETLKFTGVLMQLGIVDMKQYYDSMRGINTKNQAWLTQEGYDFFQQEPYRAHVVDDNMKQDKVMTPRRKIVQKFNLREDKRGHVGAVQNSENSEMHLVSQESSIIDDNLSTTISSTQSTWFTTGSQPPTSPREQTQAEEIIKQPRKRKLTQKAIESGAIIKKQKDKSKEQ
ncbi:unnamed protein product, partial [Didymodactylos carnosus]